MKNENLIGILFDLLSKKKISSSYLAEKYGISKRTVFRYIDDLTMAKVPVYSTRGKGGGITLYDSFKLPASFLTEEEYDAVLSVLESIESQVPDKRLEGAINKIKTSKKSKNIVSIKGKKFLIDTSSWSDANGNLKNKLAVIEKAVEEQNVLHIVYYDRNGNESERDIEPHTVVFKNGLWYVYAYCKKRCEFRLFKTGRIKNIEIKNEKFVRREDEEIDFSKWYEVPEAEEVLLEIEKAALSEAEEWLGIENIFVSGGKNYAKMSFSIDNGLVSKLLGFGSGIKVLSPEKLKREIKTQSENITKMYD